MKRKHVVRKCDCDCCIFVVDKGKDGSYNISIQDSSYISRSSVLKRIKNVVRILLGRKVYYSDMYINNVHDYAKLLEEMAELLPTIRKDMITSPKTKTKNVRLDSYVVSFIFSSDMEKVLMQLVDRGIDRDCWNGVGGKIEKNVRSTRAVALNLLEEEASISGADLAAFIPIVKEVSPEGIELNVFAGIIAEGKSAGVESKHLRIESVKNLLSPNCNMKLSGDGSTTHFIQLALSKLNAIIPKDNSKIDETLAFFSKGE